MAGGCHGTAGEIIFDKNEEMKGRELYVFIEGKVSDENACIGRTYCDAADVDGYIFINTDEELMTGYCTARSDRSVRV